MTNKDTALSELWQLGQHYGIEPVYQDGLGVERQVGPDSLRQVLESMGVSVSTPDDIRHSLAEATRRKWMRMIDAVLVHYHPDPLIQLPLSLPLGDGTLSDIRLDVQVTDEKNVSQHLHLQGSGGTIANETIIDDIRYVQACFPFTDPLPLGYFRLTVRAALKPDRVVEGEGLLIVAPRTCYMPSPSRRDYGISLQLYGLRSPTNWGIGDFRDLGQVMKIAGSEWGVSTVGINPLHLPAAGLASPYSPSSRLFWNPVYINVESVHEWRTSKAQRRKFQEPAFQQTLRELRETPQIDYEAVGKVKWQIFEELFLIFSRRHLSSTNMTPRGKAFARFLSRHQPYVTQFCAFQALTEHFGSWAWRSWPEEYRHPLSPEVKKFCRTHRTRIQFYQYVQWLCELQLQQLDHVAKQVSLSLRLYHDLPVGIHPDGADAWIFQDQMASNITVGAPPDWFNLNGQNWGLAVPNPVHLREAGYQFLRATLRQNMRHGGVLRIDHALGLFRMFWIPPGGTGQDGVYVRTHVDEILAVLALESVRRKVMVVGEDLGTVTPAIRRKLDAAGLLSYRLLLFEREANGAFTSPEHYPQQALVAATTHDLPTLRGFWTGRDITIKDKAGLYPRPENCEQDWRDRAQDRQRLGEALERAGLNLPDAQSEHFSNDLIVAVYRFLARTPSQLLIVQLEDLLAELDTPNLPGAAESVYPSWRVRIGPDLHTWLADPAYRAFWRLLHRERHGHSSRPGILPLSRPSNISR